jgi:hypothetical protein
MRPRHLNRIAAAAIASLALTGCTDAARRESPRAAPPIARPARRPLPTRAHGADLVVGVDQRGLPGYRVNLQIHLLAQRVFTGVRPTLTSPDRKLAVPSGCTFQVLRPPIAMAHKPFATPLPAIPLCSLVLSARTAGTYPLDLQVLDGAGKALAPPLSVWVRIRSPRS